MSNLSEIRTETRIGTFVVYPTTAKVVHVVNTETDRGGCSWLSANKIVYEALIEGLKGEKGRIMKGYTFTTTIDTESFFIANEFDLLIDAKTTKLFPTNGGVSLI